MPLVGIRASAGGGWRRDPYWGYGDSAERDVWRVQIRETIKSQLQKGEVLFGRGIKCLSIFFIDEVAKYRTYDADGGPGLGECGRML